MSYSTGYSPRTAARKLKESKLFLAIVIFGVGDEIYNGISIYYEWLFMAQIVEKKLKDYKPNALNYLR